MSNMTGLVCKILHDQDLQAEILALSGSHAAFGKLLVACPALLEASAWHKQAATAHTGHLSEALVLHCQCQSSTEAE